MKNKFTRKELQEFKKLVVKAKENLLDELKQASDNTLLKSQKDNAGDISGYTYHMADAATDTYDREFSMGIVSKERQRIYEIDAAYKKIEDGSYGVCESCKKLIPKPRLKAIPYAKMCLKCQSDSEKR